MGDEELLREQASFYRARAPEYDDWWSDGVATTEANTKRGNGTAR